VVSFWENFSKGAEWQDTINGVKLNILKPGKMQKNPKFSPNMSGRL
jgi:hypothetical protein